MLSLTVTTAIRPLLLLSLVVLSTNSIDQSPQPPTNNEAWQAWTGLFNKTYASQGEEARRRAIWQQVVDEVAEHNSRYDLGLETYRQGLNHLSDWTQEELDDMHRSDFSGLDLAVYNETKAGVSNDDDQDDADDDDDDDDDYSTVPESLDWRTKGIVTSVKDQGRCGACYAFSIVAAVESLYAQKKHRLLDLSSQQLIDCAVTDGCRSGSRATAMQYLLSHGIESAFNYQYEGRAGKCRFKESATVFNVKKQKLFVDTDEAKMKKLIAKNGPVSAGVVALNSFDKYIHGIYSSPDCKGVAINHAVLVVGYGSEKGQDYWIAKNSHGTSFGEGGYIRIARNVGDMCGIASRLIWPKS